MTYEQLVLQRYILEKVKDGLRPVELTNDEKVDLDYLANYYDNVISSIEGDMKRRPNQEKFAFVIQVSKN